ncbi:MAG: NAD(P)/FAD-dependent oxidoreductase [Acidobacteriaceae bacterium]
MGSNHCDVFIAGAGPAGLAAAIALRQRGADVLLADARRPPIDKPCGEGLMPPARRALAHLGIHIDSSSGAEFTGITFASDQSSVSANFPTTPGIGVRRTTLHNLLLNRAQELGVRFSWNTPLVLKPTLKENPILAGEPITCKWLIGADGAASRIRAWASLDSAHLSSRRFGFRAHYRVAPWSTHVEVHWGPLGQAYITPIGPAEICVSVMTRHPNLRLTAILHSIPFLRDKLAAATPTSTERGALTLTRRLRRVTHGNVALIGDASGSVDAITGEGLALAFRQALFLADSLDRAPGQQNATQDPHTSHHQAAGLALYESRHARILALPQRMASLLLLLDRHAQLRARTLRALAARPALFREFLAVHVGHQPLPHFLLRHGPALATQLLIAPRKPSRPSIPSPAPADSHALEVAHRTDPAA